MVAATMTKTLGTPLWAFDCTQMLAPVLAHLALQTPQETAKELITKQTKYGDDSFKSDVVSRNISNTEQLE